MQKEPQDPGLRDKPGSFIRKTSCDVMKSWDQYLIVSVERSVLLHVLRTSVDPDDPDVVGLRSQAVHDEEAASGPRSRNRKLIGGESGRHHGGILCND